MPDLSPGITVVIPTIPTEARHKMLERAIESVNAQIHPPTMIQLEQDADREGASIVRDRGLRRVQTRLVAFLDDDDELYSQHLDHLAEALWATQADLVYPWFDVVGGSDPFPEFFGQPWDNEHPHQTTVTFLAKTEALLACGGFQDLMDGPDVGTDPLGHRAGEEYRLVLRLAAAGYKIVHLSERTWAWYHHGQNTMGLPSRVNWDE